MGSGLRLLDLSAHTHYNYTVHSPSSPLCQYYKRKVVVEVGKAWGKVSAPQLTFCIWLEQLNSIVHNFLIWKSDIIIHPGAVVRILINYKTHYIVVISLFSRYMWTFYTLSLVIEEIQRKKKTCFITWKLGTLSHYF